MMYDPTPAVSGPPRKRTLRRWILLVPAVILLLLAGWWWFAGPKTYRLVRRLPCEYGNVFNESTIGYSTQGVTSCLAGFCLREDECVISLRDWNTGDVKWRVTTAKPSVAEWPSIDLQGIRNDYRVGISPNGRYLAVMMAAGSHARIQSWRDGVLTGEVRIKREPDQDAHFETWVCT